MTAAEIVFTLISFHESKNLVEAESVCCMKLNVTFMQGIDPNENNIQIWSKRGVILFTTNLRGLLGQQFHSELASGHLGFYQLFYNERKLKYSESPLKSVSESSLI